jgi:hypothetical protein
MSYTVKNAGILLAGLYVSHSHANLPPASEKIYRMGGLEGELVPFVWDGDAGFFGVDCCVGVVGWVAEVGARQRLEEGRLAHIGETDNPRLESALVPKKDG